MGILRPERDGVRERFPILDQRVVVEDPISEDGRIDSAPQTRLRRARPARAGKLGEGTAFALRARVWRAGLFRGAGIKMVRGDWMRGSGMVRRLGGVLIRGSSRITAEKLPRINSAGSTGDGFSPDCGAVRRSRRGRAGGGARVRRHPAPRMPVVVSGLVAGPVGGRAGG